MVDAQERIEGFADVDCRDCHRYSPKRVGLCRAGADWLLIAFPLHEVSVSNLFLAKDLNGHAASFVRLEGPDRFIIQVDGAERIMSRDEWRSLPDRLPPEQDRRDHQDHQHRDRE